MTEEQNCSHCGITKEEIEALNNKHQGWNKKRIQLRRDLWKIPAEAAGITVEGSNKWITLIQNANKVSSS